MNRPDIEAFLASSAKDGRLSRSEKSVLRSLLAYAADETHERDWLRNRAFNVAAATANGGNQTKVLDWLEDVMGILVMAERPGTNRSEDDRAEVHFSPGQDCRVRIQELIRESKAAVDICVFTITDDRITDVIVDAHSRGVEIRIISDNDKANDPGSDLYRMRRLGIAVACDRTADHMHNKFAIFDKRFALTGSYNWTRSAAEHNEENIVVSGDNRLVHAFQRRFERLWEELH